MINYEKLNGTSVLVTGGAGFIGSHLCENLLKHNCNVVCLDNLSTGFKKNINHLIKDENFIFIKGDIRDYKTCVKVTKNVDYVLHQAALGSVPRSINDPLTTNAVNIEGFLNMLIASKENKIKKFVYAASSSTYGDSINLPKVEDIIGNPLSPYAVTKYVNELYAKVFYKIYNLNTIGLRYFNVFGARQNPEGAYAAVIPKFIKSFILGKSPIINGNGNFSRDFTFIDNVVFCNLAAISSENKNCLNQVYNVACGERVTLNKMASEIKYFLSKKIPKVKDIKVIYGPERKGDVNHSHASIKRAQDLLGYKSIKKFDYGIEKTIDWFLSKAEF